MYGWYLYLYVVSKKCLKIHARKCCFSYENSWGQRNYDNRRTLSELLQICCRMYLGIFPMLWNKPGVWTKVQRPKKKCSHFSKGRLHKDIFTLLYVHVSIMLTNRFSQQGSHRIKNISQWVLFKSHDKHFDPFSTNNAFNDN